MDGGLQRLRKSSPLQTRNLLILSARFGMIFTTYVDLADVQEVHCTLKPGDHSRGKLSGKRVAWIPLFKTVYQDICFGILPWSWEFRHCGKISEKPTATGQIQGSL